MSLSRESAANGADDREAHPKFWVAAYTRPRSEKKAAAGLSKVGIETYVPIQKQLRIWSDRTKRVDVVVIPMVIFAHLTEKDILTLKKHPLVVSVLSYPGRSAPARIPPDQIESLRTLLDKSSDPVEFTGGKFTSKDKVIVVKGGLKGLIGVVKEVDAEMTAVWIGVDLLGGTVIKLKTSELEHYE